jgi:hypothetical protein
MTYTYYIQVASGEKAQWRWMHKIASSTAIFKMQTRRGISCVLLAFSPEATCSNTSINESAFLGSSNYNY